jgi:hypothetical protein
VARGAGLLERRLSPDADRAPLIVLDAGGDGPDEHLDAAVRAAASLCRRLAGSGGCAILLPGERRPRRVAADLATWPDVWTRLALVTRQRPASTSALAGRSGPTVYVTSRPPSALPPAVAAGGALVVAPPALGAPRRGRAVFEVAGCVGYAVGPRGGRLAA